MRYYFAYGSNISRRQMAQRCPESTFIRNLKLKGYRFIYTQAHVASIVEDENSIVWGSIYQLTEEDEKNLDVFEEIDKGWYTKNKINLGDLGTGYLYVSVDQTEGNPFDNYHRHIINSARKFGFPEDYIEQNILIWKPCGFDSDRPYINQDLETAS